MGNPGTKRRRSQWQRGIGRRLGLTLLLALSVVFAAVPATMRPTQASPAEIYFGDLYGSTYAEFGPNAAIVISGFIDFIGGCPAGGVDDFIYPWADIYVVPDGEVSGHGTTPLSDVSGAPNSVQGASGGMFISETIGYTAPGGAIGVGAYDIVIDNCQDGEFNEGVDYILGMDSQVAFRVIIPADVPVLPSAAISAAKARAEEQYLHWKEVHRHFSALLDAVDAYGYIGILTDPPELLIYLLEKSVSEALGVDPGAIAKQELVETYGHYRGLWLDPPDLDYKHITTLGPISPIDPASNDPLLVATAGTGGAAATEGALAEALVRSIERYQGADAGPDQTVDEGTLVSLSGSGLDADGDPLTFAWSQTSGPTVDLNDPSSPTPSFTAPEVDGDTVLSFELTVSDGVATDSDTVNITVQDAGPAHFEDARTIGYWKNHKEHIGELLEEGAIELGDATVMTVEDAVAVLANACGKDAKNALRAQLLATILNLRNGSDPLATGQDIRPVVDDAISFLEAHPEPVKGKHPDRKAALALKDLLDAYNNSGEE